MSDRVLIPFGNRYLALPRDVFEEALRAGDPYMRPTMPIPRTEIPPLLDANEATLLIGYQSETLRRFACNGQLAHIIANPLVRSRPDTFIADLAKGELGSPPIKRKTCDGPTRTLMMNVHHNVTSSRGSFLAILPLVIRPAALASRRCSELSNTYSLPVSAARAIGHAHAGCTL
jgi:hypothetical protein